MTVTVSLLCDARDQRVNQSLILCAVKMYDMTTLLRNLISAKALFCQQAIDQRISKGIDVTARLQHGGVSQDRAIQPDHIVAVAHDDLPPILLEIIFKLDPKRAVIPHPVEPAINLARLENEPASLTQADDFFHPHPLRVLFPSHDRTYLTADHADETDFSLSCRQDR